MSNEEFLWPILNTIDKSLTVKHLKAISCYCYILKISDAWRVHFYSTDYRSENASTFCSLIVHYRELNYMYRYIWHKVLPTKQRG